ncbi:unnamed protein product, partial [Discosporangium mesarthrocarpum]
DHIRKKNCADNPRCLFGLGEGKEGIWAKRPRLIKALGQDPAGLIPPQVSEADTVGDKLPTLGKGSIARATRGAPGFGRPRRASGLKNLGATCYLNSQLQALFHNKAFRKGVYAWRP